MFFNDNDSVFMFIKEILFEKNLTYYVLGLQSSWKNHTVSKEIICPGKPCYACLCRVQIQFMGTKTACNTVEYIWQFENVRLDLLSSDSALWLLQSILNEHGDCSSFVKKKLLITELHVTRAFEKPMQGYRKWNWESGKKS